MRNLPQTYRLVIAKPVRTPVVAIRIPSELGNAANSTNALLGTVLSIPKTKCEIMNG